MKVLVTGGAGFIGSNFVHYWTNKYPNDEIVVLDKLTYAGNVQNLADLKDNPNVTLRIGDICNSRVVRGAMKGADLVVHFAAESHVDRSIQGPLVFTETNVIGTQVLLEEALRAKVKLFHHVSTDEVYGSLPIDRKDLRFNEDSLYRTSSPYSASKASSDMYVRAYHKTYGLPVTVSNTTNNYGPYHYPEKLIPLFITNLLMDRMVPLMGKGENVRDWCYVEDHCCAIDMIVNAALRDERFVGETFCVGGNSERSNLEVTKEILSILGKTEVWIQPVGHRLGHDERYAVDSSKIRNLLGWEPKYNFEAGLRKTVEWYVESRNWWLPLREGRRGEDIELKRALRRERE